MNFPVAEFTLKQILLSAISLLQNLNADFDDDSHGYTCKLAMQRQVARETHRSFMRDGA